MPEQLTEFQRVSSDSGNVTADSAIVTGHSGEIPQIGHDETESAVTFARNKRSRSIGMGGHDGPEYAPPISQGSCHLINSEDNHVEIPIGT
jgi:hypothetical protein